MDIYSTKKRGLFKSAIVRRQQINKGHNTMSEDPSRSISGGLIVSLYVKWSGFAVGSDLPRSGKCP